MNQLSLKHPTARCNHKCNFCGGKIPKDTKYIYEKVEDGGEIWTWKSHFKCDRLLKRIGNTYIQEDGVDQALFEEIVQDHYYVDKEYDGTDIEVMVNFLCRENEIKLD